MLEGKRVAVVVPAHEEERLIDTTLGGIPGFVDRIIVVDDGSEDETSERVRSFGDSRVELVVHEQNRGVGAAIVTGYKRALEEEIDVVCVMAGDNQMDPEDLEALARPVARGEVDYAKANRLFTGQAWELMPRTRYPRQRGAVDADEDRVGGTGTLPIRSPGTRRSARTRSRCSTSIASTRTTASRTTCSCISTS